MARRLTEREMEYFNEMLQQQEVAQAERRGIAKGARFAALPTIILAAFVPNGFEIYLVVASVVILVSSSIAIKANSGETELEGFETNKMPNK